MWKNDFESRLYVVKRKNTELYHTGGYRTGNKPQLYDIGGAKRARNQLNKHRDPEYTSVEDIKKAYATSKSYYKSEAEFDEAMERSWKYHQERQMAGPWVVAQIQFTATEVEE